MADSARLVLACRCGAVLAQPCPTVGDIPSAAGAAAGQGWGYDERGFVQCPSCLAAATPAPKVELPPPAQGSLFPLSAEASPQRARKR